MRIGNCSYRIHICMYFRELEIQLTAVIGSDESAINQSDKLTKYVIKHILDSFYLVITFAYLKSSVLNHFPH